MRPMVPAGSNVLDVLTVFTITHLVYIIQYVPILERTHERTDK